MKGHLIQWCPLAVQGIAIAPSKFKFIHIFFLQNLFKLKSLIDLLRLQCSGTTFKSLANTDLMTDSKLHQDHHFNRVFHEIVSISCPLIQKKALKHIIKGFLKNLEESSEEYQPQISRIDCVWSKTNQANWTLVKHIKKSRIHLTTDIYVRRLLKGQ